MKRADFNSGSRILESNTAKTKPPLKNNGHNNLSPSVHNLFKVLN